MTQPIEIQLVSELRNCHRCTSLWRADDRFGPFPLCPSADLEKLQAPTAGNKPAAVPTPITDFGLPEPAALKGCRKAPVMIIGINPNLTGFWTLPDRPEYRLKGPLAVYPDFESDSAYALAYRYITPNHHEFLMQPEDLPGLVDLQQKHYRADTEGTLVPVNKKHPEDSPTTRNKHDRAVSLGFQPKSGPLNQLHIAWATDENYVTVDSTVKAGELFAGVMTRNSTVGKTVGLKADLGSSYYDRAQQICARLGLTLGEDVSMHDMVACATPGWSVDKHGINQTELKNGCLAEARFTMRQLRQSRPDLMIFSGAAAFMMFFESLPPGTLVRTGDIAPKAGSLQQEIEADLSKGALSRRFEISLPASKDDVAWQSTAVVIPHLSYPERPRSFDQGVASTEWARFGQRYPTTYSQILQAPENAGRSGALRIRPANWEKLDALDEPGAINQLITLGGGDTRIAALTQLLADLRAAGRLPAATSGSVARLARDIDACRFCSAFNIPGGCAYDIPKSGSPSILKT